MARALRITLLALVAAIPASPRAQTGDVRLNGVWTLNRSRSDVPREVGFSPDWIDAAPDGSSQAGGRGGRGSRGTGGGAPGGLPTRRISADDALRARMLTAEVKNPAPRLTIVDEAGAVVMTDESGSRTFHPTGRAELLATTTSGLPATNVTTRREGNRLVVVYDVEEGRQIRYTYSATAVPRQLNVDIELVERRVGDTLHWVYDVGSAVPTATAAESASPSASAVRPSPATPSAPEKFDQRPDAELKGLTTIGLTVEDLTPQAAACGLSRDAIDNAAFKRLTDAGLTVKRQSDADTYIYVNVMTTSASNGLCVSRYDVFLYSHTTAKLSHTAMPVLVQADLLHARGIAGGTAASHAASVTRGLDEGVDEIIARIRAANSK